jgi:hypothetical protein
MLTEKESKEIKENFDKKPKDNKFYKNAILQDLL